jgi:hypothetical protein
VSTHLHITNGSSIVPKMHEAGIGGRIITWDDMLHEGPVPAGLNAAALREVRAQFLASGTGESHETIGRRLRARDEAIEQVHDVDEIVLWFEHDLYDQLQLIQVLDRLDNNGVPPVSAVPGDDYLGYQPAARFPELFETRRAVTSAQFLAARDAWTAFRADDPSHIMDVLDRVTDLPHLAPALRRHLQQFPSVTNGLSRTEQQTLEAVSRGVSAVRDLFRVAHQQGEEAMFMGDLGYLLPIGSHRRRAAGHGRSGRPHRAVRHRSLARWRPPRRPRSRVAMGAGPGPQASVPRTTQDVLMLL